MICRWISFGWRRGNIQGNAWADDPVTRDNCPDGRQPDLTLGGQVAIVMGEGGDGDGGPFCGCLSCPSTNSLSCPGPPSSSSSRSGFRSAQLGIEISTKDKVKGSRFGDIALSTMEHW